MLLDSSENDLLATGNNDVNRNCNHSSESINIEEDGDDDDSEDLVLPGKQIEVNILKKSPESSHSNAFSSLQDLFENNETECSNNDGKVENNEHSDNICFKNAENMASIVHEKELLTPYSEESEREDCIEPHFDESEKKKNCSKTKLFSGDHLHAPVDSISVQPVRCNDDFADRLLKKRKGILNWEKKGIGNNIIAITSKKRTLFTNHNASDTTKGPSHKSFNGLFYSTIKNHCSSSSTAKGESCASTQNSNSQSHQLALATQKSSFTMKSRKIKGRSQRVLLPKSCPKRFSATKRGLNGSFSPGQNLVNNQSCYMSEGFAIDTVIEPHDDVSVAKPPPLKSLQYDSKSLSSFERDSIFANPREINYVPQQTSRGKRRKTKGPLSKRLHSIRRSIETDSLRLNCGMFPFSDNVDRRLYFNDPRHRASTILDVTIIHSFEPECSDRLIFFGYVHQHSSIMLKDKTKKISSKSYQFSKSIPTKQAVLSESNKETHSFLSGSYAWLYFTQGTSIEHSIVPAYQLRIYDVLVVGNRGAYPHVLCTQVCKKYPENLPPLPNIPLPS